MKVLIAGDYCDKYRVSECISNGDYGLMFDEVRPIIESADISIVNFEFPVVIDEGTPIPKCGPNLIGQKQSVDAIKYAGFNVCTLANNHILDQGEQCCLDTKRLIEESGMHTVGVGSNVKEAGNILYIKHREETLAVINCCENEFSIATDSSAGANPLNPIQQCYKIKEARQNADYVLVIVHGGHETLQLPSPRMKETYRFYIDCGADAVVNHHQHCFSGFEVYNGKPIFYGLGNFLFDWKGTRHCNWNEGYMVELGFSKSAAASFALLPYTQCDAEPKVSILQAEAKDKFEKRIEELNCIIADDSTLLHEWESWVLAHSEYYKLLFQPYSSRLTIGLYVRGLLPSFMCDKKKYKIINYLECESHLDRLRCMIKHWK